MCGALNSSCYKVCVRYCSVLWILWMLKFFYSFNDPILVPQMAKVVSIEICNRSLFKNGHCWVALFVTDFYLEQSYLIQCYFRKHLAIMIGFAINTECKSLERNR